jgi:hypothetical protein
MGGNLMRSFAVEGAVFWLIVSAVAGAISSYYPGSSFWMIGIVVGLLQIVVAYFCWQQKTAPFLVAAALGFIFLTLNITISRLEYSGDEFLAMIQITLVLFSLRAFREIGLNKSISKPV